MNRQTVLLLIQKLKLIPVQSLPVNAGRTLYEVQHILGHTQVKTTQRYAHLSHDTLLDATNSVNTALGGMFMPMVSATPAAQVQLVQ
jgi:hypothetical protein